MTNVNNKMVLRLPGYVHDVVPVPASLQQLPHGGQQEDELRVAAPE